MRSFRHDKGVAGLNVLLSVVVALFAIGFLVFIFAVMGGELETHVAKTTTLTFTNIQSATACGNDTGCYVNSYKPSGEYQRGITGFTLNNCTNASDTSIDLAGNFTVVSSGTTAGLITNITTAETDVSNFPWNCTGYFTYDANNTATGVINDASDSINGVTDWFAIIIVITAMVVLILLTVLIISSIRGSGLIGGSSGGGGGFGTKSAPTTSA